MTEIRNATKLVVALETLGLLALVISIGSTTLSGVTAANGNTLAVPHGEPPDASSLSPDALISPEDLATILQSVTGEKPLTIHVGFYALYAQAHIPGSEYIGPASQEAVVEKLRKRVEPLPRKKFIVLYCGCCPWSHCPTVKPAYEALHSMGFTKLKVLYIPNNFGHDWVDKGFPVEKGQ